MDLERIEELLRTRPPQERTYDRPLPDLLVGRQPLKATVRLRGGSRFGSRAAAVVLVVVVVGGAALYGSWHQGQQVVSATPTATLTATPSQTSVATATASPPASPSPSPSQSSSLPPQVFSTAPPAGSHHLLSGQVGFAGTWAWTVSVGSVDLAGRRAPVVGPGSPQRAEGVVGHDRIGGPWSGGVARSPRRPGSSSVP